MNKEIEEIRNKVADGLLEANEAFWSVLEILAIGEKKTYTAQDMEAFAEWVDNHHTVEVRTGKQLRELWQKERGEK